MYELFLAAAVTVIAIVTLWFLFTSRRKRPDAVKSAPLELARLPKIAYCPLCGSGMEGNKLYSKLIRYLDGRKMLEIRGCRLCHEEGSEKPRKCPSCKSALDRDDYIFAELTVTAAARKVVVKGCRRCYSR